ncbi:MAG: carbohydrate binding domain-containing protein [Deltaproteobacteria bacterium]|nr:carbohydrate binding domain-containing protein [Deltaproteobacteria bacterium]
MMRSPTLFTLLAMVVAGCGDGDKKRPVGASCEAGDECALGLCYEGQCLDPDGDEDTDGLQNGLEAALGTNPLSRDSDNDGKADPDELDGNRALLDTDGDGLADALESSVVDQDEDCIVDELDARNNVSDGAADARVATLCPAAQGVCAASGAVLAIACPNGTDQPVCDTKDVAGYEATESSCDGKDNDCDGVTDAACDPLARGLVLHWKLDGDAADASPNKSDGTVVGPKAAPDRFGHGSGAMRFGLGQRLHVATTRHPTGEATVTYSVWVRPDRAVYSGLDLLVFGEPGIDNRMSRLALGGERHCARYGGTDGRRADRACAPAGHWSLVTVVKEGRQLRVYFNGTLRYEGETAAVQALNSSALVVGHGDASRGFVGVLDDLRVWDRALAASEIRGLYEEGGWRPVGSAENPGQSCLHVRDGGADLATGAAAATGRYTIDIDGDGPRAASSLYCEMDLDGGGWTLVWVYGFTQFGDFTNNANAVTPIPSWPVQSVTVPVSTTAPSDPATAGAVDWSVWSELGREVAIRSDLSDSIACLPGAGSLADGLDGWVDCRMIEDVTPTCDGVVPGGLFFGNYGPSFYASNLYYYFDGNETDNWPTHDPCGENKPQHVANPTRQGGAVYLRETDRPVQWPGQCDWIGMLSRVDGVHRIDPDGLGDGPSFDVECDFSTERGGWTRVSTAMEASLQARQEVPREYLLKRGDAFYRSPIAQSYWADAFASIAGWWFYDDGESAGAFLCGPSDAGGEHGGIGCSNGAEAPGLVPDGPLVDGAVRVCQADPNAFGEVCTEASLWVREFGCIPDGDGLLGDGELDAVSAASASWESPCWFAYGPEGWKSAFQTDTTEIRPGGRSPTLRVDNPTAGNFIANIELGQQRVTLIAGRAYTFSFWAKAAAPRKVRPFIQSADVQHYVHHEDLALTTEWARYDVHFVAPETLWNTMVSIQLADETPTVWLDALSLTDDGPGPR